MNNIYLLHGENKEAILEFQDDIAKQFIENIDELNYIKLNMTETTIEELLYECNSVNLFSDKKIIVAENSVFLENKKSKVTHNTEKLLDYFNNINEDVLLIIKCEKLDSRKKIVKEIKNIGVAKEFNLFNEKELVDYAINYLRDRNIDLKKEDALFLLEYGNLDFANLKTELKKLELYCMNSKVVLKEDITNIISRSIDYEVFSLTNELFSKNYNELMKVYNGLKTKGEEPVFLLSLISSQIRLYCKVKILLQENFSQKDIAQKLAVHPYRIQLAIQKIYNIELETLIETLNMCVECDRKLKTSYTNKYIIFEIFINKLFKMI